MVYDLWKGAEQVRTLGICGPLQEDILDNQAGYCQAKHKATAFKAARADF
jgi:hypothetical protein